MNNLGFSSLGDNTSAVQGYPVAADNALGLSNPDSMLAGQLRGTQNVGGAGAAIDAANNVIRLTNPATGATVGFGNIPGSTTGEFGFFGLDGNGNVVFKIVGATFYVYDATTTKNIIQLGKLPDSTYGEVVVKPGFNISDAFS